MSNSEEEGDDDGDEDDYDDEEDEVATVPSAENDQRSRDRERDDESWKKRYEALQARMRRSSRPWGRLGKVRTLFSFWKEEEERTT